MTRLYRLIAASVTTASLSAGLLVATAPMASADSTPAGTVETAGCSTGVQWRMGYRMFFVSSNGATLQRGAPVDLAKKELQTFVDRVGAWTSCEARIKVDLFDEGAAVYGDAFGTAESAWTTSRGYDATIFRYPDQGDRAKFVGSTNFQNIKLPVTAADEQNTYSGSPYFTTTIHEWLHVVHEQTVKANAAVQWPQGDVHASFAAYSSEGYAGAVRFYHDLVTGQYMENGIATGMKPGSWTRTNTPTHYSGPLTPTTGPSPSPTASPSPTPSPTVSPSPTTSPSPSPTPSPSISSPNAVPEILVSPSVVKFGQQAYVTIFGGADATVDLYSRKYPQSNFVLIRSGIVLDPTGQALVLTKPDVNLRFMAKDRTVDQGSSIAGSDGLMTVQKTVSINVRRLSPGRYTFFGSINPMNPGATVRLYRGGTLVKSGIPVSTSRSYTLTATLPPGTYRVLTPSTGYNATSWSNTLTVSG